MRAMAGIFIIALLLLMSPLVSAADPLILTQISTSNPYPVANGADQAVITVSVQNTSTLAYIAGTNVTFTVDPGMGTISPQTILTDASGKAVSTFTVKTKSGTAHINVTAVDGIYTNANPTNIDQKIDHDAPYFYNPDYAQEGVVGTNVPFVATYTDYWGNPIDNVIKPGNHSVTMTVYGPPPDDSGFF